ncbi:MAG: DUF2142 domain-containing protein [Pyrinomonadaceae bacterium]|nr:DUF2142 domain-containing protein [Phycisphaerales bacterium]
MKHLPTAYLVLALTGGTVMTFLTPPFQAPDEPNHFFRALSISEGQVHPIRTPDRVGAYVNEGQIAWTFRLHAEIPNHPDRKCSIELLRSNLDVTPDPRPNFADLPNTATNSPVCYLPHVAGLLIGRTCGLPMLYSFYLGRFLCMVVCVALCHWACRQLPLGRLPFVMIALSPMVLFLAASLSADSLTFALSCAFCARVLNLSSGESGSRLTRGAVAGLCVLGGLMMLTKASSALFPLLTLLLLRKSPVDRGAAGATAEQGSRPWMKVALILAVVWAVLILWTLEVKRLYVPGALSPGTDPDAQLRHIFAHPLWFMKQLWQGLHLHDAVGMLGWHDTSLGKTYVALFYVALVLAGLVWDPPAGHPTRSLRLAIASIVVGSYMLVIVLAYLGFNDVGSPRIRMIAGRYFLPFAVLIAVLLQWHPWAQEKVRERHRRWLTAVCVCYSAVFLGHAFYSLAHRYWL